MPANHSGIHRILWNVAKYLLYWFAFRILGRLPMPALYFIADGVAALSYRVSPNARAAVMDNVRHAIPDASERKRTKVAKQIFRNATYYYAELAHVPYVDGKQFLERVKVTGIPEHLAPSLATGKGAVLLSAHYGNPEVAMQVMLPLGIHIFAVTEPVEPPALSRLMNSVRSSKGIEFKPVGLPSVKRIVQTVRGGHCVALMGDRDIAGPRMRLPFLGEETWMPTGPIEVAIRNDVPVFPTFSMRRGRGRFEGVVEPPLTIERTGDLEADTLAAMLQYIERLEARLRAEPDQWAVLERIWDAPAGAGEQPKADTVAA